MYVPLWCKSNYSFLEGASHPEELVEKAHALQLPGIAITDRNGYYGIVRAFVKARELGIHLLIGSEVSVDKSTVILLAKSCKGYENSCRLISRGSLRNAKGNCQVRWSELCDFADGLLALPTEPEAGWKNIPSHFWKTFADSVYLPIARHRTAESRDRESRTREFARQKNLPLVAANEVLYHNRNRRFLQDVLCCVHNKTTLAEAGDQLCANSEHDLKSFEEMNYLFADDSELLGNSLRIAKQCRFSMEQLQYRYPAEELPNGHNTTSWLRELTFRGAHTRYGKTIPTAIQGQIDKELQLINELEYDGYFLTMVEIVQFCRQQNILCQGRGSAANSAVCFCLGVTAVDPNRMNLLFERFLSKERAEPPDIDLDIEHQRREEVIQWMYQRYGRDRAAMVANVVRYRTRSAIREVGKTLGISSVAIDQLAKLLSHHGAGLDPTIIDSAGLDIHEKSVVFLIERTRELLGFPRHLSIHPGGFLLGDRPIIDLVPIENGSMPGRTVIQWDKDDLEELKLFKVDLLGLGALNVAHRCFDQIRKTRDEEWSMATIPSRDPKTYAMIQAADTIGVFQIESRAQMSMLPRLRPKHFYDLVVQISIVRPGPISGGMVHPYLRRRNGEEDVIYPHAILEPVLERTLGVPLFQEQVMQLAVVAADYTPGEADQLRRDMAAWRRTGRIEAHREKLISRMEKKGIAKEFAERVFEQIRGFGEYGFPESHAASFALIAYATSWLRCHYPSEFLCAMLNAQPMGFYSASTLVEDAKRHGVFVLPVDINRSNWDCSMERLGKVWGVRIGLRNVHGLSEKHGIEIEQKREAQGIFATVKDLLRRCRLNRKEVSLLAQSGALRTLSRNRRDALWKSLGDIAVRHDALILDNADSNRKFAALSKRERVAWDHETTSLSTYTHPLATIRKQLQALHLPTAAEVREQPDGAFCRYAGIVICRQRPGTAAGVTFLTLEDETGFVNVVVWKAVFERYFTLLKTCSFLGVQGPLQNQNGVQHLIARSLWKPTIKQPQNEAVLPALTSHDFH